jgi:muramoyltetrapeptide carboxypeptidase
MNRKYFLSSLLASAALLPGFKSIANPLIDNNSASRFKIKIPKYLKIGNTIGITSPAGYITTEQIQSSVLQMESWGLKVKVGDTIGKRDFTFGGTDEERRADFQDLLDDPNIDAIMCARGGYGFVRIIDLLDFTKFKRNPKWIIGFSDITVIHCHLSKQFGIASIHSKMCNSFPDIWENADQMQIDTITSIKNALFGQDMSYSAPFNENNKLGKAEGILVGGNLSIIETLAGSISDLDTRDKILFIEDTGEYPYSIDRMLWNLKRNGKLDKLKGLIVGGFKYKPEDVGSEFGRNVYQIVMEKVAEYNYPISFDFPVGHQKNNYALKCGIKHSLEVAETGTILNAL